jgi:hypothetical protein
VSSKVRHFCPPGYDKAQILQGIHNDLAQDIQVGQPDRVHEFHPHHKGEPCNLDECRRIELEGGDLHEAILIDTSLDLDLGSMRESYSEQSP